MQRTAFGYVLDPIRGTSQWNVIDVPSGSGRLEVLDPDFDRLPRDARGPFAQGTLWTNLGRHRGAEEGNGTRRFPRPLVSFCCGSVGWDEQTGVLVGLRLRSSPVCEVPTNLAATLSHPTPPIRNRN